MGEACSVEEQYIAPLNDARPRSSGGLGAERGPHYIGNGAKLAKDAGAIRVKERHNMGSQELFEAAMHGDVRKTKFALQAHADANAEAEATGLRALHVCAVQGHVNVARELLNYKADMLAAGTHRPDAPGFSPLSLAGMAGHREMVRLLISEGAPLDGPEGNGGTPLLHAARRNCADICETLLRAGANANATFRKKSDAYYPNGEATSWHAVMHGSGIAGGPRNQLERTSGDFEWLLIEGVTPLHFAAAHGSVRVCEQLLHAGARTRAFDKLQRTPLMLSGNAGHVESTRLLLDHHAAVSADVVGHSIGSLAAWSGHTPIIQVLFEFDVIDVNYVTRAGAPTMLHVAAHMGHGGCVGFLCESDADVDMTLRPGGLRPLMLAAAAGHIDICRELVSYGAAVCAVDDMGRSAWFHAAANGRYSICRLLEGYGAVEHVVVTVPTVPQDLKTSSDMSPLMYAESSSDAGVAARRLWHEENGTRTAAHSSALQPNLQPRPMR